ncbi:MAG: NAD(P)-dependent oxidoreductase [Chloroflexi bacterium]|nr:NAD(P)-dependent oxidoreductase [Chloroflexota bacterium]
MPEPKVLVTGASGLIGGLVLKHLSGKYEFSALNRRPVAGVPCLQADIAEFDAIRPAFKGVETVLHLSAYTKDIQNWDETMRVTVHGTLNVFKAAHEAGVKRVVFMSSGSTMCGWEWYEGSPYGALARGEYDKIKQRWKLLDYRDAPRPDSPYAVGKLYGEACGRWYSDEHGMSVLVIRLGAVLDTNRPKLIRHFPGYLDHVDAVQMIDKCLSAPMSLKYDIFDAISENSTRWRDTSHAKEVLGWKPTGTSDKFDPNEFREKPGPGLPLRF